MRGEEDRGEQRKRKGKEESGEGRGRAFPHFIIHN